MSGVATLRVWRGVHPVSGRWETHEVPFEPGQSVLDGLRWIRANRDPSLAIRFSCINANACKECMIELDGRTVYACTARLEPREMVLAPLANKRVVRDLVTEIGPPSEQLMRPPSSVRP
jgi:succinate dehydrogenase/fumarate reductase-like Fe-S protein